MNTKWIQASTGWFGRTFSIGQEKTRSFIWTPEDLGPSNTYGAGMNYYVRIPKDGEYTIEAEVWAPNQGSDSFFVTVFRHEDDGMYKAYDFGHGAKAHWRFEFAPGIQYSTWCVIKVNHVNAYVTPQQQVIPIVYKLEKGEYLVKIDMREDGAKLSKFRFVGV